ncbi:MAG TPA: hypothetical protein PKZ12_03680 [Smithellaceae bacterium]|nr:hypothetical protein [Smithellaceae bacterium]
MKKIIIAVQVVVIIFLLVKGISLLGLLKIPDLFPDASLTAKQAHAQQTAAAPVKEEPAAKVSPDKQKKNVAEDSLTKQRDLAAALIAKKIELDKRESSIQAEEQRLLTLRKEITDKINQLRSQEEKIAAIIDANQTSENKRFKEMAKVYESTPPGKAGPMLEKLDTKTAAGITMNMKKDKAGAIWGYITPQKAVEITKEITRVTKQE